MKQTLFLCALMSALFFSCKKEDQLETDIKKIEDYLAEKGLNAQSTESGLHYIVEVEGTGEFPTLNDKVTVKYKGYYLDGEVFDEGTTTSLLSNYIEGWREGIPFFKKGGKGKLLLPSGLAYGSDPPPGIRKNAVMVFDVELVDF
jgi:FKBP-type peptidyl-prolyl cis-trans isomerase FkpA